MNMGIPGRFVTDIGIPSIHPAIRQERRDIVCR